MATIAPVVSIPGHDQRLKLAVYSTLTTTNADGAPLGADLSQYTDRSVQVVGTFGSGGTIAWQVSNDGVNWHTADTLYAADAATWTAAELKQIVDGAVYARPFVSAGDGTTDLDVHVYMRAPNHGRT